LHISHTLFHIHSIIGFVTGVS